MKACIDTYLVPFDKSKHGKVPDIERSVGVCPSVLPPLKMPLIEPSIKGTRQLAWLHRILSHRHKKHSISSRGL